MIFNLISLIMLKSSSASYLTTLPPPVSGTFLLVSSIYTLTDALASQRSLCRSATSTTREGTTNKK